MPTAVSGKNYCLKLPADEASGQQTRAAFISSLLTCVKINVTILTAIVDRFRSKLDLLRLVESFGRIKTKTCRNDLDHNIEQDDLGLIQGELVPTGTTYSHWPDHQSGAERKLKLVHAR